MAAPIATAALPSVSLLQQFVILGNWCFLRICACFMANPNPHPAKHQDGHREDTSPKQNGSLNHHIRQLHVSWWSSCKGLGENGIRSRLGLHGEAGCGYRVKKRSNGRLVSLESRIRYRNARLIQERIQGPMVRTEERSKIRRMS